VHIPAKFTLLPTHLTGATTFVKKKGHHFHLQLSLEINMQKENFFVATQKHGDHTPDEMY